ncbi:erythrocyte membrane protein related [Cystoisospora suis]|uniref:Erythrocyte membrane protein related n=1 Tax=Cystoisospora suis TaxID=483139 RepID=A0A2C6LGA2_9APIC|nr:erythrocyte membrane protein related [Cystoisospora suis]
MAKRLRKPGKDQVDMSGPSAVPFDEEGSETYHSDDSTAPQSGGEKATQKDTRLHNSAPEISSSGIVSPVGGRCSKPAKRRQKKPESGGVALMSGAPEKDDSAVHPIPAPPPWAKEQREALERLTDGFYARHRLYLRVWPVTATTDSGCKRKGGGSGGSKKPSAETGDEAAKLRQEQLINMRVMLYDRVAENLSFTCTQYNTAEQPRRNHYLPDFLKPRNGKTLRSNTDAASASFTKLSAGGEWAEGVKDSDNGGSQVDGLRKQNSTEPVHSSHDSAEPITEKVKELQNSLLSDGFTGCWVLLLSEKYIPPTEDSLSPSGAGGSSQATEGGTSAASNPESRGQNSGTKTSSEEGAAPAPPAPRVRRVIVCGALIEVYSNNERQISALWCLPCLSARSTRILLQAFLPRLVIEAFKLPDVFVTPPSKALKRHKKKQKCRQSDSGPGNDPAASSRSGPPEDDDEDVAPSAPPKSIFAVCEDTLLWPRQALFLLGSPARMGFLRHMEPLQAAPELVDSSGDSEESFEEQPQLHVDAGLGVKWRQCNCRRRFSSARAKAVAVADDCVHAPGPGAFLRFFSVSELWATRLIPAKGDRSRLDLQEGTADVQSHLENNRSSTGKAAAASPEIMWPKETDGWSCLVPGGTCEGLIEEIYGGMPFLRQYSDDDLKQLNVSEDEMCGLTEEECKALLVW